MDEPDDFISLEPELFHKKSRLFEWLFFGRPGLGVSCHQFLLLEGLSLGLTPSTENIFESFSFMEGLR